MIAYGVSGLACWGMSGWIRDAFFILMKFDNDEEYWCNSDDYWDAPDDEPMTRREKIALAVFIVLLILGMIALVVGIGTFLPGLVR
jgi:hypothetical protein